MRTVRIGVVGAGWWSTGVHIPALRAHRQARLVGVCDRDEERARTVAARHAGAQALRDHRGLLGLAPEAVVVATPHDTHFEIARDCLRAGAHVLVEKPMVLDPAHGRELVALARASGLQLHVGYPFLYTRHARALAQALRAGRLGDPLLASAVFATAAGELYRGNVGATDGALPEALWAPRPETYGDAARGGGQARTQATHAAALLLHLTGLEPETVFAFSGRREGGVDEWDAITFQTAGGAAGSIATTGTVARHQHRFELFSVFGDRGHAILDTARGRLRFCDRDGVQRDEPPLPADEIYPAHAPATRLVDAALGHAEVVAGGELGLATAELIAAALDAARAGAPVRLDTTRPASEVQA